LVRFTNQGPRAVEIKAQPVLSPLVCEGVPEL
jgi:hypothetical protein